MPAETTDTELLRGMSVQLRSLAENQSRDAADLGTRLARVEDDLEAGRGRTRSLAGLAAVTAVVAFLATSLIWQLGHRAAAIDRGVREMTAIVTHSASATEAAFAQIDGRISEQSAKVDRIAAAVVTVQAAGERAMAALDGVGRDAAVQVEVASRISRQLTDTALDIASLRSDVHERFAKEHDSAVAGRAEMLRTVTDSITRVERVMLEQATELRSQREQLDVTARRLSDSRRQLLAEATTAVGAQLDGLRQILDGLRAEASMTGEGTATVERAAVPTDAPARADDVRASVTVVGAADTAETAAGEEPLAIDDAATTIEDGTAAAADGGQAADAGPVVATLPEDTVVE